MASTTPDIDLNQVTQIHFIGIGGIGMSGLARHFVTEKKKVRGSDREPSDITQALAAEGIEILTPQAAANITDDIDLVVYTEAITEGSDGWAELQAARERQLPTINYFDALGLAMNPYYLIAVAGTHGKTTTTAMITDIFEAAELDPTAVVGSLRAATGSNYRAGKSKYALVEACEYKADFLSLRPEVLVITNLEHDHVDYFKTLEDVQAAFAQLINQVSEDGVIVTNPADPNIAPILSAIGGRTVVDYTKHLDPQLGLKQPGLHNRLNAAAALAAATTQRIDVATARAAVTDFRGTWRRFQYKGDLQGAPVYDDYAHHPTAVALTVAAVRELYPDKQLITVFKPHTYSRTAALFAEFAKSFAGVDQAVFLPIYAAREENTWGVSSRELAVKTLEYAPATQYCASHAEAVVYVRAHVTPDTVVVVMGAGDATLVAEELTSS